MKVLVTGASGFIGRHLVRELLNSGHAVSTLHRGMPLEGVPTHTAADVLSEAALDAALGVDGIIHLAGLGSVSESFLTPERFHQVNAVGTLAMLGSARANGAAFVLASSQRVYEPGLRALDEQAPAIPTTPYGYSKLVAETWVRAYARLHDVRALVGRIFSVYGPAHGKQTSGGAVAIFVRNALTGEPLLVTGNQRQDLTYVEDIARGLRLALERGIAGEVYNLATGVGTHLLDLAHSVRAAVGSASPIEVRSKPLYDGHLVADVRKAEHQLGFRALVPLDRGLERYVKWARAHG